MILPRLYGIENIEVKMTNLFWYVFSFVGIAFLAVTMTRDHIKARNEERDRAIKEREELPFLWRKEELREEARTKLKFERVERENAAEEAANKQEAVREEARAKREAELFHQQEGCQTRRVKKDGAL